MRQIAFAAQKPDQAGCFNLTVFGQGTEGLVTIKAVPKVFGVVAKVAVNNLVTDAVAVIPVTATALTSQRRLAPDVRHSIFLEQAQQILPGRLPGHAEVAKGRQGHGAPHGRFYGWYSAQ